MAEWGGSMYLMTVASFAVPKEGKNLNVLKVYFERRGGMFDG